MRKYVLGFFIVICLCAGTNKSLATMSLGWWEEGAVNSTHERWDFTPGYIAVSGTGYTAVPESLDNPYPNRVTATILGGQWDGVTLITGTLISVNLEIPNYQTTNPYKDVWVDTGSAVPINIAASAVGVEGTTYTCQILPGQGNEFGVRIWPNPYTEKISFMILGSTSPAVLDYIHVDTICIPEPVTVVLLGLGAMALRRRK